MKLKGIHTEYSKSTYLHSNRISCFYLYRLCYFSTPSTSEVSWYKNWLSADNREEENKLNFDLNSITDYNSFQTYNINNINNEENEVLNNKNLVFEIEDTGKGISSINISKIQTGKFSLLFNRDYNNSTGSGLGMGIVNILCKLINAKLEISSKVGKGSLFRVILPNLEIKKIKIKSNFY